jgi:predicted enzyme related to lactoylglutathione lyase
MAQVQKVGMVIHPVEDLEAAIQFYETTLGLSVKLRDGDRFCAMDAGGVTIALAAGEERLSEIPLVSYKVADVDTAVRDLVAAGAIVERPAHNGPHERRALLRDPDGNPLMVYASR